MIRYADVEYNHGEFLTQLSEGSLKIDVNYRCNIDCTYYHRCTSECPFFDNDSDDVCIIRGTYNEDSLTKDPVHIKFRETYPELFI